MVTKKPSKKISENSVQQKPTIPIGPNGQPIQIPRRPDGTPLSGAEIIKNMKDTIKVDFFDTQERVLKIIDQIIAQLAQAANQLNQQQNHINKLESFLKENGISLDAIIQKPGNKGPNRETRRKIQKAVEKTKKSA